MREACYALKHFDKLRSVGSVEGQAHIACQIGLACAWRAFQLPGGRFSRLPSTTGHEAVKMDKIGTHQAFEPRLFL